MNTDGALPALPLTQSSAPQTLCDRAPILALLNRLRRHHRLLSAQSIDLQGAYSTLILNIDVQNQLLHLDMLHPEPLHAFATDGPLWLCGRMDGGRLRFRCRLNGLAIHDEGPALRATLPDQIELHEQRRSRRLPIPESQHGPRAQLDGPHGSHPARLLDISAQGAGALMANAQALPPGTQLDCRIELPGVQLLTRAEVRTRQINRAQQRLGLRFMPLGPAQEDRLMATLNQLERQMIRSGRAAA